MKIILKNIKLIIKLDIVCHWPKLKPQNNNKYNKYLLKKCMKKIIFNSKSTN